MLVTVSLDKSSVTDAFRGICTSGISSKSPRLDARGGRTGAWRDDPASLVIDACVADDRDVAKTGKKAGRGTVRKKS
jgi:hypothetical protein